MVCNLLDAGNDVIDLITDWLFLDSDLDVVINESFHQVIMPHNLQVKPGSDLHHKPQTYTTNINHKHKPQTHTTIPLLYTESYYIKYY